MSDWVVPVECPDLVNSCDICVAPPMLCAGSAAEIMSVSFGPWREESYEKHGKWWWCSDGHHLSSVLPCQLSKVARSEAKRSKYAKNAKMRTNMGACSKTSCIISPHGRLCQDLQGGIRFGDHICMSWECAALTSVMICDSTQPRDLVRAIQHPGA